MYEREALHDFSEAFLGFPLTIHASPEDRFSTPSRVDVVIFGYSYLSILPRLGQHLAMARRDMSFAVIARRLLTKLDHQRTRHAHLPIGNFLIPAFSFHIRELLESSGPSVL